MRKILFLSFLLLATATGGIQARENRTDSIAHATALEALNKKGFVLQANYVMSKNGVEAKVDSVVNFVAVHGDMGVVQIAIQNSVCGVTMEGKVGQWELITDRKGNTVCTMNIDSEERTMRVAIVLPRKGGKALATVSSCKHVKGIAFGGDLLPGDKATIQVGPPA